ncbi:DUF1433 domain-containing protein [Streptococcus macacae]|uniref:Uncharacterized protein n=1 Tax=Streptococcus macacae NCTC 11558 TaxID=764298 RepID=G5JVR5_9STRE|nr:DUF1433 domain-containing protein [Streptococcus macacae]EHJ52350.1 hypothetical protein STRMA_0921 [Streptococcus macacae NCTC 11558]SUN78731.1 exported protein [Streptococcus macacae NCTC 11558]
MAVKKKVLMPLGIAAVLIIGGIIMFNPFTGKDEPKYKHEQDRMVKYLVQNYEGIKKVEFTEIEHNKMTGSYSFYATINNKIKVNFTLMGLDGEIYVNELSSRNHGHSLKKLDTPDEKPDISHIEVKHLEE